MNTRTACLQISSLVTSVLWVPPLLVELHLQPQLFSAHTGQNRAEGVQGSCSSNKYVLTAWSLQSMVGIGNMYKAKSLQRIREIVIKRLQGCGISIAPVLTQGLPGEGGCCGPRQWGRISSVKLRGTQNLSGWRRTFQAREVMETMMLDLIL